MSLSRSWNPCLLASHWSSVSLHSLSFFIAELLKMTSQIAVFKRAIFRSWFQQTLQWILKGWWIAENCTGKSFYLFMVLTTFILQHGIYGWYSHLGKGMKAWKNSGKSYEAWFNIWLQNHKSHSQQTLFKKKLRMVCRTFSRTRSASFS